MTDKLKLKSTETKGKEWRDLWVSVHTGPYHPMVFKHGLGIEMTLDHYVRLYGMSFERMISYDAYEALQKERDELKRELNQKVYELDKSRHDHMRRNEELRAEVNACERKIKFWEELSEKQASDGLTALAMLKKVCEALKRNQQGNVCKDTACNCVHGQNEAVLTKAKKLLEELEGE